MINVKRDKNTCKVSIDSEHITVKTKNDDGHTYKIISQAIHDNIKYEVTLNKCIICDDGSFEVLADYDDNLYTMVEIGGIK